MFAKLTGKIDYIDDDSIIINVNGVGYLVYVTSNTLKAEFTNNNISLFIQTLVKEDAIALYGFDSLVIKRMFNLLMSVQGVGAKLAITVLSTLSLEQLQQAILQADINLLKSISGVGTKVAQRLSTELKDKLSKIFQLQDNIQILAPSNAFNDTISALKGLGYNTFEINKIMPQLKANANTTDNSSTEYLLKYALKLISKDIK